MSDFFWDALIGIPVLLLTWWLLKGKWRQREERHADFQKLARELGLQFNATHMGLCEGQAEPSEQAELRSTAVGRAGLQALSAMPLSSQFTIDGSFDAVPVSITLHQRSGDGAGAHTTRLSARIDSPPGLANVSICRSYAVDRLLDRATGGQDIELGDAAFDDAVRVRGTPAEAVRAWLSSADTRQHMQRYLADFDTGSIDAHGVHLDLAGAVSDSARVRTALQATVALSKALNRA